MRIIHKREATRVYMSSHSPHHTLSCNLQTRGNTNENHSTKFSSELKDLILAATSQIATNQDEKNDTKVT